MNDFYGEDLDYIHLKFGRMQKMYNFTEKFRKEHPSFCAQYEKYWNNEECVLDTPLKIAQYVDMYDIPVKFYYNFTDEPSKSMEDVYEYLIRECSFGEYEDGGLVGWDGEKENQKTYKVKETK